MARGENRRKIVKVIGYAGFKHLHRSHVPSNAVLRLIQARGTDDKMQEQYKELQRKLQNGQSYSKIVKNSCKR